MAIDRSEPYTTFNYLSRVGLIKSMLIEVVGSKDQHFLAQATRPHCLHCASHSPGLSTLVLWGLCYKDILQQNLCVPRGKSINQDATGKSHSGMCINQARKSAHACQTPGYKCSRCSTSLACLPHHSVPPLSASMLLVTAS